MNARQALIYNDILVFSYNIETIIATYREASFLELFTSDGALRFGTPEGVA